MGNGELEVRRSGVWGVRSKAKWGMVHSIGGKRRNGAYVEAH